MSCYTTAACNTETDQIVVQALPMLVAIPGSGGKDDATSHAVGVSCGSRHTVILTKANVLWAFGWNKYGQVSKFTLKPKFFNKQHSSSSLLLYLR